MINKSLDKSVNGDETLNLPTEKELGDKDRNELMSLLQLYHTSEQNLSASRSTQTATFMGEIIIIIGGCIAVFKTNSSMLAFLVGCFGGLLALTLSGICYSINKRTFRIQTEFMARIGKIEDLLGFSNARYKGKEYWLKDTLMIERYFNSRNYGKEKIKAGKTIEQIDMQKYIDKNCKKKFNQLFGIKCLCIVLMVFSIMIIVYAIQRRITCFHDFLYNVVSFIK